MRLTLWLLMLVTAGLVCTEVGADDASSKPTTATPEYKLANGPAPLAENVKQVDLLTINGVKNLYNGYPTRNDDSSINAIVEIPSGTNAKWEINHTGKMELEIREGAPRVVKYLPYPCNYGVVASTKLAKETGGDGDPVDVLILGPALSRGTVAKVKVVGLLKLVDKGELDHKVLAVMDHTPLAKVKSLKELNEQFPGVTDILQTWFTNYKGPGKMVFKGWGEAQEANELIERNTIPVQQSAKR